MVLEAATWWTRLFITERQIAKKRQPGEEHFLLNNLISLTVCQVANLIYGEKKQKQLKE